MSLRDIRLGFTLGFDDPDERDDSEDLIVRICAINCKRNLSHILRNPDFPLLYDSHILYTPPDQADGRPPLKKDDVKVLLAQLRKMGASPETALMVIRDLRGVEVFLDAPNMHKRGLGDCNELVPLRVAELWRAGIPASPYLTREGVGASGGTAYHVSVIHPDGSIEDPSLILGMGNIARAADRREECRKNVERWANLMQAGDELIGEGADPNMIARQIDLAGFVPKSGVFKSPYDNGVDVGNAIRRAA